MGNRRDRAHTVLSPAVPALFIATEPLRPAVRAVPVGTAINIVPASGTLASFVGQRLLITLNQRVVLQTAWSVVVVDHLVAGRIDAEVEVLIGRHFSSRPPSLSVCCQSNPFWTIGLTRLYYLLTELALERLPCKMEDHGEHDGVRHVDRERRTTRRQADEDAREEEVEQSGNESELDEHFVFKTRKNTL